MSNLINIKKLYLFYFLYFLILPLGLLIRAFYSRTLSIHDFGIIYALISFFGLVSIIINFGISSTIMYFIPKYLLKKDYKKIRNLFWYAFSFILTLSLLFSLIIFFFSNILSIYYFKDISMVIFIKIFLFYFILMNLLNLITDLLVAFELNLYYQLIKFFELSFILGFSIVFYFFISKNLIYFYLISWVLGFMLTFIFYFIFILNKFKFLRSKFSFEKTFVKKVFNYSFYAFLANIAAVILNYIDILLITFFLSLESVAIYSNSFSLITIFNSILSLVSLLFLPIFSKYYEKGQINILNLILEKFYNLIIYLILPILLFLVIYSKELIFLIYGDAYLSSAIILSILGCFSLFLVITSYNIVFLSGLGLIKNLIFINIFVVFFNSILDILVINIYGLKGVALITGIGWLIMAVYTTRLLFNFLNFKIKIKTILKICVSAVLFIYLLFILKKFIFLSNIYLNFLIIFSISYFIYILFGYFLKIYFIKDLYLFIPNNKFKTRIEYFHKKYFGFLK